MAGLLEIRENLRKEARDNGYCFYKLSYADGFKTWRKTRDESAEQVEAEFKRYNAERVRQKLDPVEVPTVVQIKEEDGHRVFPGCSDNNPSNLFGTMVNSSGGAVNKKMVFYKFSRTIDGCIAIRTTDTRKMLAKRYNVLEEDIIEVSAE